MRKRILRRAAAAFVAMIGLAVCGGATSAASAPASAPAISASRRTAIVTAAERVSPAVVSVSVVATRTVRADPFPGMFRDEFFQRFFPPTEYQEKGPGLGSGVIVDRSGLVLTNEHVVRDADEIAVTLPDGRQIPAKVLGSSAPYDLAVIKITGESLPVAPLGDSDRLVVGEWAIAIGNPFGYLLNDPQPSVTAGVISATHRDVKSEASSGGGVYKNMIQTDAAINPGNSGGPLVNGDGEVIGINTFIFTQSGGSIGLGFAIPINLAKKILDETQRYGRVRAAWPGMAVQPVTPYLAQRLGYTDLGGLIVTEVVPGGPAAKAGLKVGDRIRKVNGQAIHSLEDARRGIYGAGVGDRMALGIERDGRPLEVAFILIEAPRGAQ
ncbi:MAG: trypsin-like peptidase domain-containing protein [Candidatus Eisenbacteria bacterium]|nr:trypsin-like peptidase domain-containing protein [Candidatus Eisenbacteria bacterium]